MKKTYKTPVLTAEEFDLADVIAASTGEPVEEESTLEDKNSLWEVPAEI